ncbi:MAG: hypothetical protein ABL882_01840 [Sphingopyxis sp.]
MRVILALFAMLILSGCVSTATSIITAPVRAVGRVADLATTSQSESDENRGRAMREREEALGRLERRRAHVAQRCERGDGDACATAEAHDAEIARLRDAPLPR